MRGLVRGGLVTLSAVLAVTSMVAVAAPAAGSPGQTPRGTAATSTTVAGPKSFAVTATLDGRTERTLSNRAFPDQYPDGSSIVVVCQAEGDPTYAGSRIWDLTSDGLWVPDHFVATGYAGFSPDLERCSLPKSYVVEATLDGRRTKKITDHAFPDRFAKGDTVEVSCQAFGGPTYEGSYLWDRTVDGKWIPDHYVKTGTAGLVVGLPRCDADSPGGSSGNRLRPADLQFSSEGAAFIASFEGFRAAPYNDAGGHCTIGYGHLIHRGGCTGSDHSRWGTLSQEAALGLLWRDSERFADGIRTSLAGTLLKQHEFDALVSLAYNIGVGGFNSSSVRADLAANSPDYESVPANMLKWVRSDGGPLCGLHRRRVNEGDLFQTGSYDISYPPCPYSYGRTAAP